MPLIIEPDDWNAYLEGSHDQAQKLVKPNDMAGYIRYAVSPKVNSVKAEGADLIEPIDAPNLETT